MWKGMLTYAKTIGTIAGALGVMWAGFRGVDKVLDNNSINIKALDNLQEQQVVVLDSLVSLSNRIQDLTLTVEGVGENTVLMSNYVEGVNKAFSRHLLNSPEVSKEDYNALMQIVEELKKNDRPTAFK